MAYYVSGSVYTTVGAQAFWAFKNLLVQAGFTVVSSSNGTLLQSGDMFSSSWTGLNNSNAYYIIKQPSNATLSHGGHRREWGIQRGASGISWRMSYTVSSSHRDGGTASTMASGSDRKWILESTSWQQGTVTNFFEADSRYIMYMGVNTSPPYGWYFISLALGFQGGGSYGNINNPNSCIYFDPLLSGTYSSLDQDPTVHYRAVNSATPTDVLTVGATSAGSLGLYLSGASGVRGWMGYGISSGAFTGIPMLIPKISDATNTLVGNLPTNFFTGKAETFPAYYLKPTVPTTNIIHPGGIKGVSGLVTIKLTPIATLSTINLHSASVDSIVFGDLIFPWNESPSAII